MMSMFRNHVRKKKSEPEFLRPMFRRGTQFFSRTRSPGRKRFRPDTFSSAQTRSITAVIPIAGRSRFRPGRSEEHTSELQSHLNLVFRHLLQKKKKTQSTTR